MDVSDACFIQIDGLELISQAKHHWTYSAIIDFLVDCHLKRNLTDFDEPIVYDFDVDGGMMSVDDVASEADLALKVIEQYNKHKGAKLKLVRMIRILAVLVHNKLHWQSDGLSALSGCLEMLMLIKSSLSLSIEGAEEEVNYKLNHVASILAKHQVKDESSSCNSVSSDVHAGAGEEMNDNLIDGAPSLDNTCLVKDESRSCNNVSSDSASEMSWVAIEPRDCKLKLE